jgi:tRNA pseudouridine55 synthase
LNTRDQTAIDGVLLINKPEGPTSHDVVLRLRRTSGERTIGHTGTLDPRATGLLPLVLGRATKIASILTGGDKVYEAAVRLGFRTSTDDSEGVLVGEVSGSLPADDEIRQALENFLGDFEQVPPAHSAKKVNGKRAYALARRAIQPALKPVVVTVRNLEWLGRQDDVVRVRMTTGTGFYVRAFARDLGLRLGCGGHLQALRRVASSGFDLKDAIELAEAERMGREVARRVIAPADALPHLTAVRVTEAGLRRVTHGNSVGPEHLDGQSLMGTAQTADIRILAPDGHLVALARLKAGALHPVVVLG